MTVSDKTVKSVIKAAAPLRGHTAVIGLSGGADSVCLTHILKNAGFSVVCAHVNHCLRGTEADADEEFVKDFCKSLGIKLYTVRRDVAALSMQHGTSCEDEGRRIRYEFFESIPEDNKIIVTAHNKNDAAETVLLHLLRGSGGLKGIPEREGILRPLIGIPRREIERYCAENGLSFRTDSTNLKEDYTRNKLRLSVMPQLEKINPSFCDAILRAAEISAAEHEYVKSEADKIPLEKRFGRYYAKLKNYERPVLLQLIRRMYERSYGSDKNLGFSAVSAAADIVVAGKTGRRADLFGGIFLETEYDFFSVGREFQKPEFNVRLSEKTLVPEIGIEISLIKGVHKGYVLDADKVWDLAVRCRKNGDRCEYHGHTKKLKDILIDLKIPKYERASLAVLESCGKCAGVLGIGINKEFLPDENTVNFITIDWRKYNE